MKSIPRLRGTSRCDRGNGFLPRVASCLDVAQCCPHSGSLVHHLAGPRRPRFRGRGAAFPLGGIGTGNVSIGARGELRDWEIANHPDKGTWLPVHLLRHPRPPAGRRAGQPRSSRPADPAAARRRLRTPLRPGGRSASARLDARCAASIPLARRRFRRRRAAGRGAAASLHAAGAPRRRRVRHPWRGAALHGAPTRAIAPVDVTVAGIDVPPDRHRRRQRVPDAGGEGGPGRRRTVEAAGPRLRHRSARRDHRATARAASDHGGRRHHRQAAVGCRLLAGRRPAVLGRPHRPTDGSNPSRATLEGGSTSWAGRPRTCPDCAPARSAIAPRLAPGETRDFEFLLTWHFPNRPRAWNGTSAAGRRRRRDGPQPLRDRSRDAWEVAAARLHADLPALEASTRGASTPALFDSTLPRRGGRRGHARHWSSLEHRPACPRRRTRRPFAAWEGSFDDAGSCEGTCTHVWSYAQTVGVAVPVAGARARAGSSSCSRPTTRRMQSSAPTPSSATPPWGFTTRRSTASWAGPPAATASGASAATTTSSRELWPGIRRALEFASATGTPTATACSTASSTTPTTSSSTARTARQLDFLAALRPAPGWPRTWARPTVADRCARRAPSAARRARTSCSGTASTTASASTTSTPTATSTATGCLSDQLLGQFHAHAQRARRPAAARPRAQRARRDRPAQLPARLPRPRQRPAHVCPERRGGPGAVHAGRRAAGPDPVRVLRRGVDRHRVPGRRPPVYDGLVDEGLEIVRAVRARHDGARRNPWNEVECGNHYARSLATGPC